LNLFLKTTILNIYILQKYKFKIMAKLIKAEHPEQGIWYFTTQSKAAEYIGCTQTQIRMVLTDFMNKAKGWTLEYTEDGDILNKYINPEK